jgi:hypothetical protein
MKAQITMTITSKFVALALLATSAAIIGSSHPSNAQSGYPPNCMGNQPCCTPATKTFSTGMPGWTVKPPNAVNPIPAVPINPINPSWLTVPGSKWIGNVGSAAQSGQPGGTYVYTYHLGCLCPLPPRVTALPVTLSLQVYADDGFIARINGVAIGQHTTGYGFNHLTSLGPITAQFQPACDNVLTIEVQNWDGVSPVFTNTPPANAPGSPTGLDAEGTISGYFVGAPLDRRCPVCRGIVQSGPSTTVPK